MTRKLDPGTIVRPAKFAHLVLRVRDVEKVGAWYARVVGMKTVFANAAVAFMTYDDEHHRLALIQTPKQEVSPPGAAGMDHFAYSFETLGDLLSTYQRLAGEGIRPVWAINHGPTTSLYYEDPEGNRVEFQVDNFESREALDDFLASDVFAKNPIGVEFDPDALVRRYLQGDAIEELVKQGSA